MVNSRSERRFTNRRISGGISSVLLRVHNLLSARRAIVRATWHWAEISVPPGRMKWVDGCCISLFMRSICCSQYRSISSGRMFWFCSRMFEGVATCDMTIINVRCMYARISCRSSFSSNKARMTPSVAFSSSRVRLFQYEYHLYPPGSRRIFPLFLCPRLSCIFSC